MLTDARIKAAKPRERAYKLSDAGQLYPHVTPAGGRLWRMNYTYGTNAQGKPRQKTLSFGAYPAMTLTEARSRRDEAKSLLREGHDPSVQRRITMKARRYAEETTFEGVANALSRIASFVVARHFCDSQSRSICRSLSKSRIAGCGFALGFRFSARPSVAAGSACATPIAIP